MDIQTQTTTLPPRALGPYELVREAGSGGMSTVYEARDTRIGRRVALKVVSIPGYLSPDMKQAQAARIKREARSIARLSHPNIVSVHDVGEQDGHHYIVMEFLDGQTLRSRMNDGPPLSTTEILHILEGVAGGLDAVHAQNVVHRDVKPSNVMLLPDGRVKLMDFGVARQVDDTMVTQAGTMVGSPAYMAPEQIEGQVPTLASDVWSLGALLYEMLAGHPPFTAKGIPQVMYQIAHNPPPPIPGVSPAVQQILNRALEKDPAKRFASAGELVYAFRRALNPEAGVPAAPVRLLPAAARAPRPTTRAVPLPPRQARSLAGALAVLLVALLLS
ncbi:MAG: serine/threonine protein kinase, partial [Armatimonadota bacterium]|nr:serine/threonine protein kinase [Armatimonadota bacterium]